jgi:hypothetical protein
VEVGVANPPVGDPVHRRHLDGPAEQVQGAPADVVPEDDQHIGCTLRCRRLHIRRPVRDRVSSIQIDDPLEFPLLGHFPASFKWLRRGGSLRQHWMAGLGGCGRMASATGGRVAWCCAEPDSREGNCWWILQHPPNRSRPNRWGRR